MSVRFTAASSQKLARTTGLVDYNSDYTFVGWFYFLTTAWQTLFHVTGAVGSRNDEDTIQYNGDFGCLYIDVLKGGSLLGQTGNLSGSFPVSANTWYHVGLVRSGTTLQIYQNGVSVTSGSVTASVSGRTAAAQMMLAAANAGDYGNFRMAGVKLYSSALTAEQIASESAALRPLFLGGSPLIAIPGLNTYDDLAGYSWTATGTPTFEDGPAVGYGNPVIVYPYAAASGVTGTLSSTLGAVTASATGTVAVSGTDSTTLGAVSSSASGAVAVTASLSSNLSAVTSSAAGTVAVAGTDTSTLGTLTDSATGTVAVAGTLTATLGTLTDSATGTVSITGSDSSTLGAVTTTTAGAVSVTGTLSATLGAVTVTASGSVGGGVTGNLSATLGSATASAAGAVAVTGSDSTTLASVTPSASGAVAVTGSDTSTLGALSVSATGTVQTVTITGTLSTTLGALTSGASGGVAVSGALNATLDPLVLQTGGATYGTVELSVGAPGVSFEIGTPTVAVRIGL